MMKKEIREVLVVYCDLCGMEAKGGHKTFDFGTPEEKHGCNNWNPDINQPCSKKMESINLLKTLSSIKRALT